MKNTLSVIFPLYNEEKRLHFTFKDILKFNKKNIFSKVEYLFIDDGSTDSTFTNIKKIGAKNKQIGLVIECDPLQSPNNEFWDIINNNKKIGKVTSAVYSPRLEKNIALAIIESNYAKIGSRFKIRINDAFINCEQVSLPFYDPKKSLAKQ